MGWLIFLASGAIALVAYMVIKAQLKKPTTGLESLVGSKGVAKSDINPRGKIQIHGEIWNALLEEGKAPIKKGEEVEVVKIENMKLVVKKPVDSV